MKKIGLLFIFSLLFLPACTIKLGSGNQAATVGVFKSVDRGEKWVEKNQFLSSGGVGKISGVNVLGLTMDPSDKKGIYINSDTGGLLYSYDGAESWQKAVQVGDGLIESIAIDSEDKCTIYATFANTILKSDDCNRNWSEIFLETRGAKFATTALAVDLNDSKIVYAGNAGGEILKSIDGGVNWQTINKLGDKVVKILVDPNDSGSIYFATKTKGIYKSEGAGLTWVNINDGLKSFTGANEFKAMVFDLTQPGSLIIATKYGLLKTSDGGNTWEAIKLVTQPGSAEIYSLAVNPKNNKEIYYATATTFYKTTDGGNSWVTKRLPTNAAATAILIDPVNPDIIYMGFTNIAKKK